MAVKPLEPVPEDWQRALAIVAHPDDLEYGASSAVAKWTAADKDVIYVLATRGEAGIDPWPPDKTGPIREAEERESARLVGVQTVEFLGYQDGIVEYGAPLRRDLARAIRKHRPEIIITGNFELTFGGNMLNQSDHRTVGLAVCDAARDAGNRWIFPELIEEGFEPWSGTRLVFVHAHPEPTHGCDVSETIEQGIASLKAHRAYTENLGQEFDVEAFLSQWAGQAGARMGCQYAVEFRLLKV